VNRIDR